MIIIVVPNIWFIDFFVIIIINITIIMMIFLRIFIIDFIISIFIIIVVILVITFTFSLSFIISCNFDYLPRRILFESTCFCLFFYFQVFFQFLNLHNLQIIIWILNYFKSFPQLINYFSFIVTCSQIRNVILVIFLNNFAFDFIINQQ